MWLNQARENPIPIKTGSVQVETKDGKWNKRYLRLEDGVLKQCKSERVRLEFAVPHYPK